MAFEGFKGSVPVSSGLVGPNDRDIPLIYVRSIQVGSDSNNRLDNVLDEMQTQLDEALSKSGGTVDGVLVLTQDPIDDNDAVNKKYVDEALEKMSASSQEWEFI